MLDTHTGNMRTLKSIVGSIKNSKERQLMKDKTRDSWASLKRQEQALKGTDQQQRRWRWQGSPASGGPAGPTCAASPALMASNDSGTCPQSKQVLSEIALTQSTYSEGTHKVVKTDAQRLLMNLCSNKIRCSEVLHEPVLIPNRCSEIPQELALTKKKHKVR